MSGAAHSSQSRRIVTNGHAVNEYHSKENNLLKQNASPRSSRNTSSGMEQQKGAADPGRHGHIFQKVAMFSSRSSRST
jgi:hypothetical protein